MGERLPSPQEIMGRQLLFFERSDVQNQFFTIASCVIIGWLISRKVWSYLRIKFPQATDFNWTDKRLPLKQYLAALLSNLDFPIISLGLLNLIQTFFVIQDWKEGLVLVAIRLMWVYFVYQFCLVSLYAVFPLNIVRQFHRRLFAPLLILFILGTIISLYNDFSQLAQVSLFNLFNTPISLKIIFTLIAGLYFWVVIITLMENSLLDFVRSKPQLDLGSASASLLLARYFLITLGIVLILGYIGVNGTAIAAVTGGLSVGIGFGLQQVVSNFVSGILLLFEGVLKPGDIISVGGQTSEVKSLGIRATTVRMLGDNSEKIIPNQTFFTTDVTTYTGSDRLVYCSVTIGVGYDSKSQEVMDLLLQIAKNHPKVLTEPSPSAFLIDFGDSSINFELKFWLNDINTRKRVISDISCEILTQFTQHNIEIPFPQRDINIRNISGT
ncbi:mechanosensitive ion channel domain-containing protein [Crocosphaera sp. UHCC 0190]|uniref:mechanosensitive ion channel family protein n=1 Tax=Crocosphaera sp. UHCC 0190 TaxID=3110246 RepID=UPI002B21D2B5|nr:mechanosensitive ion channel domain-containing protein [Crocosphaera sp. UHCC 0190]MEA5508535.1 mechanosensitive ion channel domain-containing protein [Crocosphaera sp. UHCC 0190]